MSWRARISPDLAIIAACARPYVTAAARVGYRVAAFDIFNDVETRRLSFCSSQVDFRDGGFDASELWSKLFACLPAGVPVVYGSGLETQPELLARIADRYVLLGNSAETVAAIKDPARFFALLDRLGIAHPQTRLTPPAEREGWLMKKNGGSGGTHIRAYATPVPGCYYQQWVEGTPVSLLFVAHEAGIDVVGCNEQWVAPAPGLPFRFGGAVGNAMFQQTVRQAMADAARTIAAAAGLRGLNSMDFMLRGDALLALEINPRLSASFDLYDIPGLLDRHLAACQGLPVPPLPAVGGAKAQLIFYAGRELLVDETMVWPAWAADVPPSGIVCRSGEPLCSVLASAHDAEAAKALAFARARQLDAQLRTF